ncbi:hypothetical protein AB1Y20_007198 [Prymnesium parvum]|uniref:Uncharacterized protein n=1 Tax=Prymnesium parvum TaxID=97485 RepID=A0AB34IX02_PRYPA
MVSLALSLCLTLALARTTVPSLAPTPRPLVLHPLRTPLRASPPLLSASDDARRFLSLGPRDADVEAYLLQGRTLLGARLAVVVCTPDDELDELALLIAAKLVKLGGSVLLLAAGASQCVRLSSRVVYARCVVRQAAVRDAAALRAALGPGVEGLIATPPEDEAQLEALCAAGVRAVVLTGGGEHPALRGGGEGCVLRLCPLFGGEASGAQVESLLSDALGLQELWSEMLEDLGRRTGLDPEFTPPQLAALLPPGVSSVQLTHCDDAASAAVFLFLSGLSGRYTVCSAPTSLQTLFDLVAESKGWERPHLRKGGEAAWRGGGESFASSAKLVEAGYVLQWPELTRGPDSATGRESANGAPDLGKEEENEGILSANDEFDPFRHGSDQQSGSEGRDSDGVE